MRSSTRAAVLAVSLMLLGTIDASACIPERFDVRHGLDPVTPTLLTQEPIPITVAELTTAPQFDLPDSISPGTAFPSTRIPNFETQLYALEGYVARSVGQNASAWNIYLSNEPDGSGPLIEVAGAAPGCGPQDGPVGNAVRAVNSRVLNVASQPRPGMRVRVIGPLYYRGPGRNAFSITPVLRFERPGDDGGSGGGGGAPVPPPPPPPFQLDLGTIVDKTTGEDDFDESVPVVMTASDTQTLDFRTGVQSSFNSDIHLSISTDAQEHEDFRVSLNPEKFAAPGTGHGEVTIRTGPLTFPRTYAVTLSATDGTQVFGRTFQIQVVCDPPFILGTDQPKNIMAVNGADFELEVKPSGTGPFFYQWYRGVPGMTRWPIAGATSAKMRTSTRENSHYWVRVSNACGSVDSQAGTVSVTSMLKAPLPTKKRGS